MSDVADARAPYALFPLLLRTLARFAHLRNRSSFFQFLVAVRTHSLSSYSFNATLSEIDSACTRSSELNLRAPLALRACQQLQSTDLDRELGEQFERSVACCILYSECSVSSRTELVDVPSSSEVTNRGRDGGENEGG